VKKLLEFGSKLLMINLFSLLFLIVSINNVSASENISLSHPYSINYGENFSVELRLINFSEDVYDIKIDIWNESSRLSRIYNDGEWKSTIYYVNNAINTSSTNSSFFSLNITKEYNGEAYINVSIRKSGSSTSYKFGPYYVNISYNEEIIEENNPCENITVLKIIDYPENINFGESKKIKIYVNGSCYDYDSIKIVAYGSSKRVIADSSDDKITSYSKCQNGKELDINGDSNFDYKFYAYSNCDHDYEEGEYEIGLRFCYPSGDSWEKYDEFMLSINFEKNEQCENSDVNELNELNNTNETDLDHNNTDKSENKNSLSGFVIKGDKKEKIIYEKDNNLEKVFISLFLFTMLLILFAYNKLK